LAVLSDFNNVANHTVAHHKCLLQGAITVIANHTGSDGILLRSTLGRPARALENNSRRAATEAVARNSRFYSIPVSPHIIATERPDQANGIFTTVGKTIPIERHKALIPLGFTDGALK
jgi:hypothetical protein